MALGLPLWSETGAKKYFGFLLVLEQMSLPWAGSRPSLISVGSRGKHRHSLSCSSASGLAWGRDRDAFVIKQCCWGLGGWQGCSSGAQVTLVALDAQPNSHNPRKQRGGGLKFIFPEGAGRAHLWKKGGSRGTISLPY